MTRLRERPTGDLMVLMVALTVCGSVVFGGMAIIVVTLVRPDVDVSNAARNIADLLNTLIGLLAGFLAGSAALGSLIIALLVVLADLDDEPEDGFEADDAPYE